MTKPIQLPNECSTPTTASESPHLPVVTERPSSEPSNIVFFERYSQSTAGDCPDGFVDIDSLVDRDERDSQKASALAAARKRLVDQLPQGTLSPIALLRLQKGWSQKQLASQMSSSQSHVARIEAGTEDLRISTIIKLAAALDVSVCDLVHAIAPEPAKT